MPIIEFLAENRKIQVGKFSNIKTVARRNGIHLGNGVVEVVQGAENLTPKTCWEKFWLKGEAENKRMAGQTEVLGDVCLITDFPAKPSRQ
jgi:ferredoxin